MTAAEPRIPIALQTRDEKRRAERFGVELPLQVDGREGTTRDLSASGLCFDAQRPYRPGERVRLTIEYLLDGHNYPLSCEAEVVRCEALGGNRYTVGARLLAPVTTSGWDHLA